MPSKMNPVQEGGNQFQQLFEKMPAKRIGRLEDVAGAILYLCSQAGVSQYFPDTIDPDYWRKQSYVDGHSLLLDGGRILLANGQ